MSSPTAFGNMHSLPVWLCTCSAQWLAGTAGNSTLHSAQFLWSSSLTKLANLSISATSCSRTSDFNFAYSSNVSKLSVLSFLLALARFFAELYRRWNTRVSLLKFIAGCFRILKYYWCAFDLDVRESWKFQKRVFGGYSNLSAIVASRWWLHSQSLQLHLKIVSLFADSQIWALGFVFGLGWFTVYR